MQKIKVIVVLFVMVILFSCEKRDFTLRVLFELGGAFADKNVITTTTKILSLGDGVKNHGHICISKDNSQIFKTEYGKTDSLLQFTSVFSDLDYATDYIVFAFANNGSTTFYSDSITVSVLDIRERLKTYFS